MGHYAHGPGELPGIWERFTAWGTIEVLAATLGLLAVLALVVLFGSRGTRRPPMGPGKGDRR
ncbi:hypothetical protein [Streptomyces sp. NPDC000229]|uniref:hypothetical protein n=1 Tax=Streptomyces sp. NPDC000229 TaxID=3154247 RepID=UPI003316F279